MYRVKIIWLFVVTFVIFLSSCVPSVQLSLPTDLTPVPETDIPQQFATVMPNIFTQTSEPVTSLPDPNVATLPSSSRGLKPPDSETPAAGICLEAQGDPVPIVLGIGPDGIPLAGRCIKITPAQRIKLINQSNGPLNVQIGEFHIDLPVGSEALLDKPVSQYLALGVHFLPVGSELWVMEEGVVTVASSMVQYENPVVGYKLDLPGDWIIDENGMINGTSKEVIFSPPNAESFIAYLSIFLEYRTLDQLSNAYAQYYSDATREDTLFNGNVAIKYNFPNGRSEFFIPYGNQIIAITTDRPNDGGIQTILKSIKFTAPLSTTFEATIMDNGKTFNIKMGDSLKLDLDWGYDWSAVSVSNTNVIVVTQDLYQAHSSGVATLSTTGSPKCLSASIPCGMPSIMFTITVIVQ